QDFLGGCPRINTDCVIQFVGSLADAADLLQCVAERDPRCTLILLHTPSTAGHVLELGTHAALAPLAWPAPRAALRTVVHQAMQRRHEVTATQQKLQQIQDTMAQLTPREMQVLMR